MHTHTCKQCGSEFVYCRACVFRPIKYKDLGYCSLECYEASKNKIEEVVPTEDVEVVVIEEDTSTPKESAVEYPIFFTETEKPVITTIKDSKSKKKRSHAIKEDKKENDTYDYQSNYGEELQSI